jgi:hypothetical protein
VEEGPKLLYPEDDSFLKLDEVVNRLESYFTFVQVDPEAGATGIDDAIQYYLERKNRLADDGDDFNARIEELREKRDRSALIIIADCESYSESYLATTFRPDEPIFFSFCSSTHEASSLPLVKRVADAHAIVLALALADIGAVETKIDGLATDVDDGLTACAVPAIPGNELLGTCHNAGSPNCPEFLSIYSKTRQENAALSNVDRCHNSLTRRDLQQVERKRFELSTSALRTQRSPN